MNIWDKIEACKPTLTPRELEIYEILRQDPYSFSAGSAMEIAARYKVPQSAISRFCQKVGFSGFADFRLSMALGLSSNSQNMDDSSTYTSVSDNQNCAQALCDIVNRIDRALPDRLLEPLARKILNASNIYTSGYGASLCAAQTFAFLLTISSIPGHLIAASQEMEALHIIKNTDLVFLFSVSNPSHRDFLSLVTDLPPEKRPYTILVSGIPKHPLRHKVSQVIPLPCWASWSTDSGPLLVNDFAPQFVFSQLVVDRVHRLHSDI